MTILIGIDDTDTPETIGTGKLARLLAQSLCSRLGARSRGVTRHQLLVHPDIPYTSHNSSACVELEDGPCVQEVSALAEEFMRAHFNEGADPGLAVATRDQAGTVQSFGKDAQKIVLVQSAALDRAAEAGIFLKELGGTGGGVIGALAAIGLRATGNDGRFVELQGIRDLKGTLPVRAIMSGSLIGAVVNAQDGETLPDNAVVDTCGWVRPSLVHGKPVLFVAPTPGGCYQTMREHKEKGNDNEQ